MVHKDLHIYNILQRSMKLYMVGVISRMWSKHFMYSWLVCDGLHSFTERCFIQSMHGVKYTYSDESSFLFQHLSK